MRGLTGFLARWIGTGLTRTRNQKGQSHERDVEHRDRDHRRRALLVRCVGGDSMTVFGVDLSLRSTGLASFDGDTWDTATIKTTPEDS